VTASLDEVLGQFRPRDWSRQKIDVPAEPKVFAALRSLLISTRASKPPPDLADITRRVETAWRSAKLASVERRDLRFAAQALFAGRALAREAGFLDDYLAEVQRRVRSEQPGGRSTMRLLLSIYLLNFDSNSNACRRLAKALKLSKDSLRTHWQDRIRAGRLLDVKGGPLHAGRALINAADVVVERLRLGLHGPFAGSNFCKAAVAAAGGELVEQFRKAGRKPDGWDKFVNIIAPQGKIEEVHRESAVTTFLDPFLHNVEPNGLREQVKPILLSSFGDPRVSDEQWPHLAGSGGDARRDEYIGIVRRWLVADTIDLFFKIIDQHGLDHHWSTRKTFWKRYFDSKLVSNAWVAFAPGPEATARRIRVKENLAENLAWGRLSKTGDVNHAVLLMTIDRVTVAEWSHMGKVRIWGEKHANCPKLYAPDYRARALRSSADFEISHVPPDNWQYKVERALHRQIGVGPDGRR